MRTRWMPVVIALCCVPVVLPLRASEEASSEATDDGFAGLRYHLPIHDRNANYAGVIQEFAIPRLGIVFNYSLNTDELNCFFAAPRLENREKWGELDERVLEDPESVVVPTSLALALLEVATLQKMRTRQAAAALEHVRATGFK